MEKYVLKLKETNKSFAIYNYNTQTGKEELIIKETQEPVAESRCCDDCNKCSNKKITDEEIIERVRKLGTEK